MKNLIFTALFTFFSFVTFSQSILSLNVVNPKEIHKNKKVDKDITINIFVREECRNDYVFFINSKYRGSGVIKNHIKNDTCEYFFLSGSKYNLEVFINDKTIKIIETHKNKKHIYEGVNFNKELIANPYDNV
jgi:hypothetical protein